MPLLDPIPSPVANADFTALEWEPLLHLVSGFASSPVGRDAILALHPSIDEPWIARQHQLTGEIRLLLEEQVSIPLGGLIDPTQLTAKSQIEGAALEAPATVLVGWVCRRAMQAKRTHSRDASA